MLLYLVKQKYQTKPSNAFAHRFFRCPFLTPQVRGSRGDGRLPNPESPDSGGGGPLRPAPESTGAGPGSRIARVIANRRAPSWRTGSGLPNSELTVGPRTEGSRIAPNWRTAPESDRFVALPSRFLGALQTQRQSTAYAGQQAIRSFAVWLSLRDKHITTARINQVAASCLLFFSCFCIWLVKQKYQTKPSNAFAHCFFRCPFLTPRVRGSGSDGRLPNPEPPRFGCLGGRLPNRRVRGRVPELLVAGPAPAGSGSRIAPELADSLRGSRVPNRRSAPAPAGSGSRIARPEFRIDRSAPAPAGSRSSQSLGLPIFYGRLPSRCLWLGLALGSPNPSTAYAEPRVLLDIGLLVKSQLKGKEKVMADPETQEASQWIVPQRIFSAHTIPGFN